MSVIYESTGGSTTAGSTTRKKSRFGCSWGLRDVFFFGLLVFLCRQFFVPKPMSSSSSSDDDRQTKAIPDHADGPLITTTTTQPRPSVAVAANSSSSNRTEYRKQQNNRRFEHFLMHIPKTGLSHGFVQIRKMVLRSNKMMQTSDPQFQKKGPCNVNTNSLSNFETGFTKNRKGGEECNLWMSEQPFSNKPERVYTVLRNPRSHTLSMYFHCKESRDHQRRAHLMPSSLDDWLKGWADAKRNTQNSSLVQHGLRKWACYNPINFQTRWIGHPITETTQHDFNIFYPGLGSNATATSGSAGDEHGSSKNQYRVSPKDLRERYVVLGDQAQMDKSICMIFTHYQGYVAEECDCTNATTTTNHVAEYYNDRITSTTNNNVAGYLNQSSATKVVDHGVAHHGDTFQTTPEQDAMIAFLRDQDTVLYKEAQKIFAEQVSQTEEKYGVKICDKKKPIV